MCVCDCVRGREGAEGGEVGGRERERERDRTENFLIHQTECADTFCNCHDQTQSQR